MKKRCTFLIIVGCLFSIVSCKKLLDVTPQSQITGQVYFQNEGDFKPYVTGIYTYMRSFANNVRYGEERSEELIVASNARFSTAWSQILSPTEGAVDYSGWYTAIGHCNLLLDKISSFNFKNNPDEKKQIEAEAYCLRAYFYFYLLRIIGDCPLMLQSITSGDVPLLPRSPAKDVMALILKDLDTAISLFPEKNFISKYRFSYAAAEALKADASLWNAKVLGAEDTGFNDAIASINAIENAGLSLSLLSNFGDITTKRANSEVILTAYFQKDETGNNYVVNALPFHSIVRSASNLDSIPYCETSSYGQGAYQISPLSRSLFNNPQDKRIPYTWIRERDGNTLSYAWITKYPGNVYPDVGRVPDNDIIIYRLGGLYLMAAEAYAGIGNSTKAIDYLNKVRERAGIGKYSGSTDITALNKAILDERGRELFFENKRWYDLVRFYKDGTIDIYHYIPNLIGKTTPIYWPLSADVLANNSKIVQTEGY